MFNNILENAGSTPLVNVTMNELENIKIFSKMEMFNPTGSVKDRAAMYTLKKLLEDGTINKDTIIIESSSGNFGLALAAACRYYGLKFYCVIDKNIMPDNERLIEVLSEKVFKVEEADAYGGYLLNRIKKVHSLKNEIANSYWINQYENPINAESYYQTLGTEIVNSVEHIDFLFMGVSSGGTITGVSNKVKEKFPDAKVIAVDIEGSVIFCDKSGRRRIPGIGSSKYPKILEKAQIDGHIIVSESETVKMCHYLFENMYILAGGSSGSVMAGIVKYFTINPVNSMKNVVTVFPDRGERYAGTIYNPDWYSSLLSKDKGEFICYI
ncbi:cysteine synthase A [Paenibacillus uliginis N3/975]|uniref:Cysteine synthase A n=1 Tax=Paenibacillus uliginis N3/975 TaxID=1313296 RepID=A0A1X7GYW1_9BACL|nr:2,3-diaminopropionate biosynthesis protein SbnA [Paenibacillus uliginis]SMF76923.1 cysteine synthase A [Paenibacillus uliginis N3/975]